jgi:4-hydroxy-tetrahydrodipicolinate reductase
MTMEIALIGYGKLGKIIEELGKKKGHSFPLIIDLENKGDLNGNKLKKVDVAIEFTTPASAPENIKACIDKGIPVVSGTTGWNDRINEVEKHCLNNNGGLFHASNFSIGVNILFAMNQKLAQIMNSYPQYVVRMEEVHHVHKLDAPSGTAITLAEQIIGEMGRIEKWTLSDHTRQISNGIPSVLQIDAMREGEVTGRHTVQYESEVDSITLSHDAKSRVAFAAGALMAAEFMVGKQGIYGMRDLLKL